MTETQLPAAPGVGLRLGPTRIATTGQLVRGYLNSTGDQGFAAHAASIKLATGLDIVPPTMLDRDVGAKLVAGTYRGGYALHAAQTFRFHRPLERDANYSIEGEIVDVFEKNEIGYFTAEASCLSEAGEAAFTSSYTRAYLFPGNRNPDRQATRPKPSLSAYLDLHGADAAAVFPAVGSMLEGTPRQLTRGLMNLYSGPGSNVHTDIGIARRAGNADTIVQGLMATSM
jgi:hypothetical protein